MELRRNGAAAVLVWETGEQYEQSAEAIEFDWLNFIDLPCPRETYLIGQKNFHMTRFTTW